MQVCVVGAGAIGALVSGYLSKAGVEVTLVGRDKDVAAIGAGGLVIDGVRGKMTVPVRVKSEPEKGAELVVLTVKTQDMAATLSENAGALKESQVLTVQNGVRAEELLTEFVPPERMVSSIVMFGATYLEPGRVTHNFEGVYLDDEGFFGLYEAAQAGGVPIFVHPQTVNPIGYERLKHPLLTPVIEFVFDTTVCIGKLITSGTLKRFPDLKFVFAHFGGVMPFIKERFDSVYHMLRSRDIVPDLGAPPASYLKQLYVDTSGVTSGSALECTISMVGVDHVLWGSDYPGNPDIAASVRAVAGLDISPEEKAAILGGNASRLLS